MPDGLFLRAKKGEGRREGWKWKTEVVVQKKRRMEGERLFDDEGGRGRGRRRGGAMHIFGGMERGGLLVVASERGRKSNWKAVSPE